MIRRALLFKYRRYSNAGYEVLFTRPPVIYYCDTQGQGIGKHISYLCSQVRAVLLLLLIFFKLFLNIGLDFYPTFLPISVLVNKYYLFKFSVLYLLIFEYQYLLNIYWSIYWLYLHFSLNYVLQKYLFFCSKFCTSHFFLKVLKEILVIIESLI